MATITYPNLMEIDFGAIKVLGAALERNGITRPLICTDKGIVATGILDKVRGVLPNEVATSLGNTPRTLSRMPVATMPLSVQIRGRVIPLRSSAAPRTLMAPKSISIRFGYVIVAIRLSPSVE